MRWVFFLFIVGCGTTVDLGGGGGDAAPTVDATTCGALISPKAPANCHACDRDASDCQMNGCYGGYWCDEDASDCRSPPSSCP